MGGVTNKKGEILKKESEKRRGEKERKERRGRR